MVLCYHSFHLSLHHLISSFFMDSIELIASLLFSFIYLIRWKIMFYDHKSWHQFRFNNRIQQENIVVKRCLSCRATKHIIKLLLLIKLFITSLLILFLLLLCNAKRYGKQQPNHKHVILKIYLKQRNWQPLAVYTTPYYNINV